MATTYSTSKVCCMIVPWKTSCCTVILTLILREWGSVHKNPASIILTLCNPRSFFKQTARSSLDSGAAEIHWLGGCSHRSQSLHVCSTASRGMPWETSTESLTQSSHRAPAAVVPSIGAPQLQQRILPSLLARKSFQSFENKEKEKTHVAACA